MDNIKALLNTISTVYAVPGNPEGWIDAVNESTHLVGGKAGVYLRINRETMITEASGLRALPQKMCSRTTGSRQRIKTSDCSICITCFLERYSASLSLSPIEMLMTIVNGFDTKSRSTGCIGV